MASDPSAGRVPIGEAKGMTQETTNNDGRFHVFGQD